MAKYAGIIIWHIYTWVACFKKNIRKGCAGIYTIEFDLYGYLLLFSNCMDICLILLLVKS
jgi:hypothetical protein